MNKIELKNNTNCSFKFAIQSKLSKTLNDFDPRASLFGKIMVSEDHAFNELSECFFEKPFSDIGTISELFSLFLKETGNFALFLNPLLDNRNHALLSPLQFMHNMIIKNPLNLKQLKENLSLIDLFEINEISEIFRLRHALKIFIDISMVLKRDLYIEEAENNLNQIDLFIYENVNAEIIAILAKNIKDDINNFAKFAELCSWAVISNSFSVEKSKFIMSLIPEDRVSPFLSKDILGLSASAYCLLLDYKKAVKFLILSFSSGKDSFIGWSTHALFKFFFGISPEYHGIRIIPPSYFILEGFQINRNFRGKSIKIKYQRNYQDKNSIGKVSLNNEEYTGMIIDFMDLKEENDILVST